MTVEAIKEAIMDLTSEEKTRLPAPD